MACFGGHTVAVTERRGGDNALIAYLASAGTQVSIEASICKRCVTLPTICRLSISIFWTCAVPNLTELCGFSDGGSAGARSGLLQGGWPE